MTVTRHLHDLRIATDAIDQATDISPQEAGEIFDAVCSLLSILCRSNGHYDTEMLRSAALVLMLLDKRQGKGT